MKKKTVEQCKDILDTAEVLSDEYFPKADHTGKRIATLAIAKILLELRE